MLKLVLLILSVWSLPSKNRIKQYLRLLNVLESWDAEDSVAETAVGEIGPAPGLADPGIEDYGWRGLKSRGIDGTAEKPNVPMLGDAPLGDDPLGDFRDYFREQSPLDEEENQVGAVGDLDLYDEDASAFHEESPFIGGSVLRKTRGAELAVAESEVGGYWDYGTGTSRVKCVEGDDKSGWMPRTYTIHMLKLKASCAAECAASPNCMAFSWDFSVPMNGRGECTYKKDFDNRQLITSSGWGSWGSVVVRCPYRPRVDYYGTRTCRIGDYRYGYMPSSATMDIPKLKQECQLECMYSDRCMAFSWNFALGDTQMGVCHYKRWFNGYMVSKLDAWGSVVVRCPPTTTTTPKGGAADTAAPAEESVSHHGLTPPPAAKIELTKEQSKSVPKKKMHVEDPGIETAVGAFQEHEH